MDQRLEGKLPLVAILRGLEPERAVEVGTALVEAGFDILEVPMNSPEPLRSIEAMMGVLGDKALIGAGTVLDTRQVDALADLGARLVVSPNCNVQVIARTSARGMVSFPGVLTPSEMFTALGAGATGLKIFPAELMAPPILKAVRAVLPPAVPVYVVGGISAGNMGEYIAAGASGFGIGGSLFKPGKPVEDIARDAVALVAAYKTALAG